MNDANLKDALAPAVLVTRPNDLRDLADRLMVQPMIAVDTESNSLFAYRERVCLVQFSTRQADYLVDPIAINDLSPLGPVFANQEVEKIFHAAEYDILCLKRDYGFEFNHLFDTMVASRILGRESFGLGDLLLSEFGIQHDKRCQRANWGQRPLPADLIDYARLDTHYLFSLRERLQSELETLQLLALADEDFNRLANLEGNGRSGENKPAEWWQMRGVNELDSRQAAILQEVCSYREDMARASDRPLFKVINDRTLIDIALSAPKTLGELGQIPGMSKGQVHRHGNQLLQAVRRGLRGQPAVHRRPPRPNEAYLERLERLRRWRKETAATRVVLSDVILPKDLMETLALQAPANLNELAEVMKSVPWRLEQFGPQILEVINR